MTSLAARTINALRQEHDDLAVVVSAFTPEQLAGPSGASEWSAAQVLSHLGSGSEISLASLRAALGEGLAPEDRFNQSVWDRWDAMSPAEQRAGFLAHSLALVEAFEALTADQQETVKIPVSYLPAPISVATSAGLRLGEAAHHGWDARVAVDSRAGLLASSIPVLLEHLSSELGFMLTFTGKANEVDDDVVLVLGDSGYSIAITDTVSLAATTEESTARFSGPLEAALRLITGRLRPAYTPSDVVVTGNVTLDDLRKVFPGF
jgi:uncharacterized protein (TIGR03083 family)